MLDLIVNLVADAIDAAADEWLNMRFRPQRTDAEADTARDAAQTAQGASGRSGRMQRSGRRENNRQTGR